MLDNTQSSLSAGLTGDVAENHWANNHAILPTMISHHRLSPVPHQLSYRYNYYWLSLSKLASLPKQSLLCSVQRPNLLSFYPQDYLHYPPVNDEKQKPSDKSVAGLQQRVCQLIEDQFGDKLSRPSIQLMTLPRHFGMQFNPVSFYFVYASDGATSPDYFIAEITNTPWGERFQYAFLWDSQLPVQLYNFQKRFHVSPFFSMDLSYQWQVKLTAEHSSIAMRLYDGDELKFRANMLWRFDSLAATGKSKWLPSKLTRAIAKSPLQTATALFRIYRHARLLHKKGVPFQAHPRKAAQNNEQN